MDPPACRSIPSWAGGPPGRRLCGWQQSPRVPGWVGWIFNYEQRPSAQTPETILSNPLLFRVQIGIPPTLSKYSAGPISQGVETEIEEEELSGQKELLASGTHCARESNCVWGESPENSSLHDLQLPPSEFPSHHHPSPAHSSGPNCAGLAILSAAMWGAAQPPWALGAQCPPIRQDSGTGRTVMNLERQTDSPLGGGGGVLWREGRFQL